MPGYNVHFEPSTTSQLSLEDILEAWSGIRARTGLGDVDIPEHDDPGEDTGHGENPESATLAESGS
jgi:hypothetical protein